MRPLELTVRGFQSYAAEQVFDLRERRLLGIVGPIGSGKSSLLDGIVFALYGKTPRAGRSVKDLINQREKSAHVELWFEVEGEVWRAVRALRREGQSAHNLYRYETADPGSERLEEVTGERAMTTRVEELLGLSFDAFNRSVFLAQNRFADFLQATASQRDAVLKGVFAFDRLDDMAGVAKATRDDLRGELADLERLRTGVETDRATVRDVEPTLDDAATRLARLDGSQAEAAELEAAVEAGQRDVEGAARRLSELGDVAAQLPAREESAELLQRATAGSELVVSAEQAMKLAAAELEMARRHHAEIVESTGGIETVARASSLLERVGDLKSRLSALEAEVRKADTQAASADTAHAKAVEAGGAATANVATTRSAVEAALEKVANAEAALHQARHDSMAVAIRKELVDGDTCPVCAQVVAAVPQPGKATQLDRAEEALGKARAAYERATAMYTEAVAAAATVTAEADALLAAREAAAELRETAKRERDDLFAARASAVAELEELIPTPGWAGEIESRRGRLAEAAALLEAATAAEGAARAALEDVQARLRNVGSELVQLATTVATLAGQLRGDLRPKAEPAELGDALTMLRKLWEEAQTAAARDEALARQAVETATVAFSDLKKSLGLDGAETISDARRQAAAQHGMLVERVESLRGRIARFEELEAASAATVSQLATYTTLAEDLLPTRFLRFILDEERRGLAALGSEHFQRMTQGRYRFTADGEFDIVDLAAAESERRAESLSGGETFLASLALALGLAEMVSRTGGRLDAFFLDEGFGSLDPEHLDLAMEGIEALVGGDRVVAVVSHVPELRERVEDLIELDTDPVTGDTVVVRS